MKPVCLVIGAGAGIGGHVSKRFALEGYHACLCRRTDTDGLDTIVKDIETAGGSATGFMLNAIEENSIEDLVTTIESDIGPIEVAVYNLGAQIGDRADELSLHQVETVPQEDQVRVVRHIARGRAQVQDRPRLRALIAPSVDMSHDIVAQLALVAIRGFQIEVRQAPAQLGQLRLRDRQAQLGLTLRER